MSDDGGTIDEGSAFGAAAYAPEPVDPPRRGRLAVTGIVAVLALAAAGFGAASIGRGDGSGSAEAAVEALFDAAADEDVIGVLEALAPNEREVLVPGFRSLGDEAKRLDAASGDLSLDDLAGVDIEVEGLSLSTTPLGDGITAVDVLAGTMTSAADLERIPVGSTIRSLIDREATREREEWESEFDPNPRSDSDLQGTRLVAVQRDGGWHVSLLYSIAEEVRRHGGDDGAEMGPVPAADQAIPTRGVDSPEAAVREAVAAATAVDVRRLIELTPSDEMEVLHRYGPLLVQAAEEGGDGDPDDRLQVTELDLAVADGPDGTKVVTAERFVAESGDEGDSMRWEFDGECTTWTYSYTYSSYSDDEGLGEEGEGEPVTETDTQESCDDGLVGFPFTLLFFPFGAGGGGVGQLQVVVEQHDGGWVVAPGRSIVESLLGYLRGSTPEQFSRSARWWAGDWWVAEPDETWEACGIARPADDATSEEGEAALEECYANLPDDYEGPFGIGGMYWGEGGPDERFDEVGDAIDEGEYQPTPEEQAEWACYDGFDGVPEDATEEEWEAADAELQACLEAAGLSGEDPTGGSTGTLEPNEPPGSDDGMTATTEPGTAPPDTEPPTASSTTSTVG